MKTTSMKYLSVIGILSVSLVCPAMAGSGVRNFSTTNNQGKTASAVQNYSNSPGQYSRQTGWTNFQGGQGSSSAQGQYVPGQGGSASRSTTYANGLTSSSKASVVNNGNGTWSENGSHTGVNGNTVTGQGTITKTADGYTNDHTYTGPNGNTETHDTTVTDQNGQISRDSVWGN